MTYTNGARLVHVVWTTDQRARVFDPAGAREVCARLHAAWADLGVECVAASAGWDHVHMLLRLPAPRPIPAAVRHVKATTARAWPGLRWADTFGALTVEPSGEAAIIRYIARQRVYHRRGVIVPELEQVERARLPEALR